MKIFHVLSKFFKLSFSSFPCRVWAKCHAKYTHWIILRSIFRHFKGCCGCCSALRPRYKRLVDNIFPVNPDDGLVKSNMEKLTFYSLSSPEKLDRIGEYLYQKAAKDIHRKRYKWVFAFRMFDVVTSATFFCLAL